ncbi:hypothetical protein, partial [Thiolapillus sp.]|uniref:hypothetical protein n=1 Tax=Thiolapillus sp. TaxID=2017437 RepID=UPI003AF48194
PAIHWRVLVRFCSASVMPFFAPCSLLFSLVFAVVYFLLDTKYLTDASPLLFTLFPVLFCVVGASVF